MFLTALLAATLSSPLLVVPPDPPESGQEAWIAEAVSDQLPRALADLGVATISRRDRLGAHAALEIPIVRVTRATSIRVAQALGARRLVTGSYSLLGQGPLTLSLRILDTQQGTLSAPLLANGPLASLSQLVDSLAWDIALAGPSRPTMTRDAFLARPGAVPFEALRSYGRGLATREPANRQKLLRNALVLAPELHAARLALGQQQLDQREFSAAHDTLSRIPGGSPLAREARFLQGVALLEIGRYRDAAALYSTLAASAPAAAVLNNHALALLRGRISGSSRASDVLKKAAELAPATLDITFNLAFALFLEGEPDGAAFFLRALSRQAPLDKQVRLLLAWALKKAGRQEEAEREWKGVVAIAPAYATLTTPDLTRRFEKILHSERPLDLGRETRSDPELAASLLLRAQRLLEEGKADEALQEATRAAYLDPYAPRIHVLLARIHRARGAREQALNEFRMSLWSRDDAAVRMEVATLLREMGRREEAVAEARKALALEPTRDDARRFVEGS